jgi:hypothetical protein
MLQAPAPRGEIGNHAHPFPIPLAGDEHHPSFASCHWNIISARRLGFHHDLLPISVQAHGGDRSLNLVRTFEAKQAITVTLDQQAATPRAPRICRVVDDAARLGGKLSPSLLT